VPDSNEVSDYQYFSLQDIRQRLANEPTHFTPWFAIAFPRIEQFLLSK
jgi:isopentenyldiphosphate isomerase